MPLVNLMSAVNMMPDSPVSADSREELIDGLCGLPRVEQQAIVDGIKAQWERRGWN